MSAAPSNASIIAVSPRSYMNCIRFFIDAYWLLSVSSAFARSAVTCSSCVFLSASSSSRIPIFTRRFTNSASFSSISLCRADCCRSNSSIFLFASFNSASAFCLVSFALFIVLASTACIWVNARADANTNAKICILFFFITLYLRMVFLFYCSGICPRISLLFTSFGFIITLQIQFHKRQWKDKLRPPIYRNSPCTIIAIIRIGSTNWK